MKTKILTILVLLLIAGCTGQKYSKLPNTIPEIRSVNQLDTNHDTYLAKINLDIYKPENKALTDSLEKAAEEHYESIKEEIEKDSLAKYEYGSFVNELKTKSKAKIVTEFIKSDLNSINNQFLFDIFANKPYFESKVSGNKCITKDMIRNRIAELRNRIHESGIIVSDKSIDSAIGNSDTMSNQLPIAAFIIREKDEAKWLIISAWEYNESVLGENDSDSISASCIDMEHIRGVIYDFDLVHEIGSFSCM